MPRRRLRKLGLDLEEAARRVALDYHGFVSGNAAHADPEAAKLFRARHDAAKVGLAHLEALMKFLEASAGTDEGSHADVVARARAALARHSTETPPGDDQHEE
jgi:hypothetical protein